MTTTTRLLNPGEVEDLIRQEKLRRRRLRLDQVRNRSRENSLRVLTAVRNEKQRQIQLLKTRMEKDWRKSKRITLNQLGTEYGNCLQHIGDAHRSVGKQFQHKPEVKEIQLAKAREAASIRGQEALVKLSEEREQVHQRLLQKTSSRELVRRVEDERAMHIASLPKPVTAVLVEPVIPSDIPIALPTEDINDAFKAARLDEARLQSDEADRLSKTSLQSTLEKERFLEAHTEMELQKEYNRIMNELEKFTEQEKSSSVDGVSSDSTVRDRLNADQEAIIEELFHRLSIPHVSLLSSSDSSVSTVLTQHQSSNLTDDESCIVNHVLVSVSTSDEMSDTPTHLQSQQQQQRQRRRRRIVTRMSHHNTIDSSTSNSTPSTIGTRKEIKSPTDDEQETIIASHPIGYISSIGMDDLSSFAFNDDQSSTKWPQSQTTFDSHSTATSVIILSSSSDDDQVDFIESKGQPQNLEDEPIFRNLEIKRHSFHEKFSSSETSSTKVKENKTDYLRRLLSLAAKNRAQQIELTESSKKNSESSTSFLSTGSVKVSDLKESFMKAQMNLKAELESRNKRQYNGYRSQSLSTILEIDSPRKSSPSLLEHFIRDGNGITDEPNLTLVESTTSSSSSGNWIPHAIFKSSEKSTSKIRVSTTGSDLPPLSLSRYSSKISMPTWSSSNSSSTESWSSCLTNRKVPLKLSTLTSSESSATQSQTTLPSFSILGNKSICLSHFFDTTSDEHSAISCPICQSSISDSSNFNLGSRIVSQSSPSPSASSPSTDDSLSSFLKHEMSANNSGLSQTP